MPHIDSDILTIVGLVALAVYIFCSYTEKSRTGEPSENERKIILEEICRGAGTVTAPTEVHVFIDEERMAFRWSLNEYRLDGEREICSIEERGLENLRACLAGSGTMIGMAEKILAAYAKNRRKEGRRGAHHG